jgi:hypothetical protein
MTVCLTACLPVCPPTCSQARVQLQLQRTCGCQDDEECDECEGVRVTLSNASNLPLVTTPGPRPKLLTLDDLNLAGEQAHSLLLCDYHSCGWGWEQGAGCGQ